MRTDIAYCLQDAQYQSDEFAKGFHDELKATLLKQVQELPDEHISVRKHWEYVKKYNSPEVWTHIKATDVQEIKGEIAPLVHPSRKSEVASLNIAAEPEATYGKPKSNDVNALKFDILSLYIQLAMVDESFDSKGAEAKVTQIVNLLRKRATVPAIMAKMPLLDEIMTSLFWNNKTLASIENMRIEVRELMKYLTGDAKKTFEVIVDDNTRSNGVAKDFVTTVTYRQKVLDFLTENRDHPVLQKIKNIEQLSAEDISELERIMWQELGTKEDYVRFLHRENLAESCGDSVAAFIRTLVKVDRKKAVQLFTGYISENDLTAEQEEYLKSILDYVCENGDMNTKVLINESPFDEINVLEIFPGKAKQVADFVANLHDSITAA